MAVVSLDDVKRIIKAIRTDILDKLSLTDTKATHTNREVLDKFTEEADTGKLLYNGEKVISPVSEEVTNKIQVTEDAVDESTGDVTTKGGLLVEGLSDTDKTTLITDLTVDKNLVVSPTNMTGNSAPAPYVVTVTSESSTLTSGYCAFDGKDSTSWTTSAYKGDTATLVIDLGVETTMDTLIMASNYANYTPASFIFYGSNDKSTYDTLLTVDDAGTWVVGEDKIFPLDNSATYRYYKLYVTATTKSNNYFDLRKIEFTYKGKLNSLESTNDNKVISYNDMYDVLTSVGTGGGTDSSTVEKSTINGNIINNGEELVVYDDTEVQKAITSLNNRSVVGAELDYLSGHMSTNQTTNIVVGGRINFDSVYISKGDKIALNNGIITLKAGTYNVEAVCRIVATSNSSYIGYQLYNITKGVFEGSYAQSLAYTYNNNIGANPYLKAKIVVTEESQYEIRFVNVGGSITKIDLYSNSIIIEETARTVLLDPTKQAQDYEIKISTFGISSNKSISANVPIQFDTSSGDIELSNNGYVKLKKDTLYMFSSAIYNNTATATPTGIKVYDVTNGVDLVYLGVCGHSSGMVSYRTTEDIEVSIAVGTAITLGAIGSFLTVQEVKNPVIVEYTPNQAVFAKTVLWEGSQVSTGTIELTEEYGNYDFLVIVIGNGTWGWGADRIWFVEYSDNFIADVSDRNNGVSYYFSKVSTSEKQLEIGYIQQTNTTGSWSAQGCPLSKIIGVKGGTTNINLSDAQKASLKEQLGLNEVDATVTTNAITEKVNTLWG